MSGTVNQPAALSQGTTASRLPLPVYLLSLTLYLLLLAALAFLLPAITPDGFIYLAWADHLQAHGFAPMPDLPEKFLPLYPGLIALISLVTGGAVGAETAGRAISTLSGAALAPLIFGASRRMGADGRAALAAAAAAALLPVGLEQYRDISVMPLFTALVALFLLLHARKNFFWSGIAVGLALTTRFEGFLLLPAVLLADWRDRRGLLRLGVGVALAGGTWWVRNWIYWGRSINTYYVAELAVINFHLPAMLLGLLAGFGPVAIFAAFASGRRLPRRTTVALLVFLLLYLGLHSWWWFYGDRFLLPLAVVFFPAAGVWLSGVWRERVGRRWLGPMLAAGLIVPVLAQAGWWLQRTGTKAPDPYMEAARSLQDEPAATMVLGSRRLLLERFSGHPVVSFYQPPADNDPHRFVARACLGGARVLVWSSIQTVDATFLRFLADGRNHRVQVELPEGRFELFYIFFREYDDGPNRVLIYNVELKREDDRTKSPG